MFNPWSIRDVASAVMEVVDPETKKKTGAKITIAGPEHDQAKAFAFSRDRKQRKQLEKTGRITLPDPEMDTPLLIDELVAVTLGIEDFAGPHGDALTFTAENVRTMYTECAWLRVQVVDFRRDTANFIQRSASN